MRISDWSSDVCSSDLREALRDAMAEEMRKDDRIFVMGEEVDEYQGAYKVTQGLLDDFGSKRVVDTPITEYGFVDLGTGAAMGGLRTHTELIDFYTNGKAALRERGCRSLLISVDAVSIK